MNKYTGPLTWDKLHQIALDVRSEEEKDDFIKYCDVFVKINEKPVNGLPFDETKSNEKNELFSWSWKMHDMVNKKIYKIEPCNPDDNDTDE